MQNLFTASLYWLTPILNKTIIFSLSLVHLLVQQTQPEVQDFKLFAALFLLLATKYGKRDFFMVFPSLNKFAYV